MLTNVHRLPDIDFSKYTKRKDIKKDIATANCIPLLPNYEIGKKPLHKFDTLMSKTSSRKTLEHHPAYNHATYYDYKEYAENSQIFNTPRIVKFGKMLPRSKDPNSTLPSYMQQGGYSMISSALRENNNSVLTQQQMSANRSINPMSSVDGSVIGQSTSRRRH